jgi:hypothetical protein
MAKDKSKLIKIDNDGATQPSFIKDTEVVFTEKDPFHKTGSTGKFPKHMAEHLVKKGLAELAMIAMLFMFAFSAPEAKGQVVVASMKSALNGSVDSVTAIATTPNYLYVDAVSNGYSTAIVQCTVTRVSSAIGGTIFLQGSVDGTNWHTATYNAGDTVTIADAASQVLKIEIKPTDGIPYKSYRAKIVGTSGDTMYVKSKFCGRYH